MALTAKEIKASVQATLDYPSPDKLKEVTLHLKLHEKLEHYLNRLNLTDRNWFLGKLPFTAMPSVADYQISAPDWGRPVLCETTDTDPNHWPREIEITDLQDRDAFYMGPLVDQGVGVGTDTRHSARVMAFYRKDGEVRLNIRPTPSVSADYTFWYEIRKPNAVAHSGNLLYFLDNFRNLLVADLSLTCLPYCDFPEPRYARLAGQITADFGKYLQTFEEYIQMDRQAQIRPKSMWGKTPGDQDDYWLW